MHWVDRQERAAAEQRRSLRAAARLENHQYPLRVESGQPVSETLYPFRISRQYMYFIVATAPAMIDVITSKDPIASVETPVMP